MSLRVLLVGLVVVGTRGVLQLGNRVRRPHVFFAAHAPLVLTAGIEHRCQHRVVRERRAMRAHRLFHHLEQAQPADVARGATEILVDQFAVQPDRLEDLGTAVRHIGADAHLRHDLVQALADRLDVVLDGFLGLRPVQRSQCLQREVRVHGLGAVTGQQCIVMHLARGSGFDNQARRRTHSFNDQVLVHRARRQQRRDRDMFGVERAVGHDQDVVAGAHGVHRLRTERRQARFHTLHAPGERVADVELEAAELVRRVIPDRADLRHVLEVEHRLADFQAHRRIDVVDVEQIGLRTDEAHQRHHELLADRVDRRIGDLRKQLLEVVV